MGFPRWEANQQVRTLPDWSVPVWDTKIPGALKNYNNKIPKFLFPGNVKGDKRPYIAKGPCHCKYLPSWVVRLVVGRDLCPALSGEATSPCFLAMVKVGVTAMSLQSSVVVVTNGGFRPAIQGEGHR